MKVDTHLIETLQKKTNSRSAGNYVELVFFISNIKKIMI